MSVLIDCPSCQRQLRVPREFLGRTVRCPSCSETFEAPPAEPEPSPPPEPASVSAPAPNPLLNVPLDLELGGGPVTSKPAAAAPPPKPAPRPRPPEPEDDDGWDEPRPRRRRGSYPCPRCDEDVRRGAVVCPYCGLDLDVRPDGSSGQRRVRLDAEPHRGTTVFGLGVASLVVTAFYLFPIGIPLGIAAWVMGHRDLRKMGEGVMDPSGRKKTRDGRTCGIIGVCINSLFGLGTVGFIALMVLVEERMPPPRPVAPMPGFKQPAWNPPPPVQAPQVNFSLSGPVQPVTIRRGETKTIVVKVNRLAGFRGQLTLAMDKARGLEVAPLQTAVLANQQQATFRVTAGRDAPLGEGEVTFSGISDNGEEVDLLVRIKVTP